MKIRPDFLGDLECGINIFRKTWNRNLVVWNQYLSNTMKIFWVFEAWKLWNYETKKRGNREAKKPTNFETKKRKSRNLTTRNDKRRSQEARNTPSPQHTDFNTCTRPPSWGTRANLGWHERSDQRKKAGLKNKTTVNCDVNYISLNDPRCSFFAIDVVSFSLSKQWWGFSKNMVLQIYGVAELLDFRVVGLQCSARYCFWSFWKQTHTKYESRKNRKKTCASKRARSV